MSPQLNLNDPTVREDPYPLYKDVRENEPVFWHEPLNSWFFFRYEDINNLLHDPRVSSKREGTWLDLAPLEKREQLKPVIEVFSKWLLFLDDADHTRLRKLMSHGFTHNVVENLQSVVQGVATELVDKLDARRQFDAATDFAYLLPVSVISDMLGVHRKDRGEVLKWSDDIVYFIASVPIPVDACDRITISMFEMIDYMKGVVAERRENPQEDFLHFLIHAEEEGNVMKAEDLLANCVLLLFAGHETTRNLVGNAIHLLLTYPDELQKAKSNTSLWKNVVDETLRFDPPIQMISRIARDDIEIHGKQIRKGQQLFMVLASGNRDPEHFPNPDRFDIKREVGKHLAFGMGPHYCLGSLLAEAEARIALETLFERLPDLKLDPARKKVWVTNTRFHGLQSLPVVG